MEILGGPIYAVAGTGESHGPAVTTIVFGCPPGQYIRRQQVQQFLDRRRPGSNRHGTPRQEKDKLIFLSGLYQDDTEKLLTGCKVSVAVDGHESESSGYEEGYTTGEPIAAIVLSTSKKSGDYSQFTGPGGEVRPGHTDLVKFHKSRGFVDVRGGGRSSYRSTISDVIGGSIARIVLREKFGTRILSSISQVGPLKSETTLAELLTARIDDRGTLQINDQELGELEQQLDAAEIRSIDAEFAKAAGGLIKETRKQGDSLGAAVEVVAIGVPPLLGEPLYDSLKLRLMGILAG